MREMIIEQSITGLQKNGLRFSVDEVAKALNISKKTIYKYFPTKEDLAIAIFNTFYEKAARNLDAIGESNTQESVIQKLTVYYESHCMIRKDVFNKYALNAQVRRLAEAKHAAIRTRIENILPRDNKTAYMLIIDGVMEKLREENVEINKIIGILAEMIC